MIQNLHRTGSPVREVGPLKRTRAKHPASFQNHQLHSCDNAVAFAGANRRGQIAAASPPITGKAKAGRSLERLLKVPDLDLTITVGRDASLKATLTERLREHGDRVHVYGWTNQMPRLLMSHHLVIAKAGGAMVQEAIAARCPMIVNQVIPGQEEGNARLIKKLGVGAVVERNKELRDLVEEVFAHKSCQWQEWRDNLERVSQPDAAVRIAELVLKEADRAGSRPAPRRLFESDLNRSQRKSIGGSGVSRVQLCDFHIHTNYSDGRLTLPEVIDFYGRRGFDCICITDHVADPRRLMGKLSELLNFTIAADQLDEYYDMLERERRRAWRKYDMLVMTGLEFNQEGFSKKTSGHLYERGVPARAAAVGGSASARSRVVQDGAARGRCLRLLTRVFHTRLKTPTGRSAGFQPA